MSSPRLALVATVLCACACARSHDDNRSTAMSPEPPPAAADCASRLRTWIVDGVLPDSAAGVAACTRADTDRALGAGEDGTGTFAGTVRPWTRYQVGDGKVRVVWSADRALVIVAEDTPVADASAALARLGAADAQWESRTSKFGWAIMDHVHARRGLTLSVGQSTADPDGPRRVFAVYFFEPTDVDGYVALGGKDVWVRRFDPALRK